jgi:hypothetical protein
MGTSLTGLTPATTYDALIKVGDNGPIDGTLKTLSDGLGNDLPMQASTAAVNFTGTLTQSGTALQPVLVSGTNIKTINSTSLLGSGNIAISASPSGVAGAIQFSDGSAFASDATNLFWDDTNNRLGVGTNAPTATGHFKGVGITSATKSLLVEDSAGTNLMSLSDNGVLNLFSSTKTGQLIVEGGGISGIYGKAYNSLSDNIIRYKDWNANQCMMLTMTGSGTGSLTVNNGATSLGATVGIKGSGSTSATTSLLVQNSAGTELFRIKDDAVITFSNQMSGPLLRASNNFACSKYYPQNYAGQYMTIDDTLVNVNFGSVSAVASAQVQIDSTTRGFLPPRMTTTQKNAIASPAAGLVLYDSTTNKLQCYNGSTWNDLF